MEKKIILTTKGNISESDKKVLQKAGVVIAEFNDIAAIKIVSGVDYFDLDDISLSALETVLNYAPSNQPRAEFADKLLKRVVKKNSLPSPPQG